MTRNENSHMDMANIDRLWTTIRSITVEFCVGKCTSLKIVRTQFPLRPSAAKAIHRSQGDTEREIVVNLETDRKIPHVHYTVCGLK